MVMQGKEKDKAKKKLGNMAMPSRKELEVELEFPEGEEEEGQEEFPAEGDEEMISPEPEHGEEGGPLAELSDEELMAEMKKRGLMAALGDETKKAPEGAEEDEEDGVFLRA